MRGEASGVWRLWCAGGAVLEAWEMLLSNMLGVVCSAVDEPFLHYEQQQQ